VDLAAQDGNGNTALMTAATLNQNPEAITTLLKAGADTKAKDINGNTVRANAQQNGMLRGIDAYKALEKAMNQASD
jgi:ankyrin repeat protein